MGPSNGRVGDPSAHTDGTQMGYFTYTDGGGVQVIVGRLADVPSEYRADAKYLDLSKPAALSGTESSQVKTARAGMLCVGETACLHITSFLLGAAAALVLGGVAMLLFRKSIRLLAILAGIILVAALTVALLTSARRQAGLPSKGFFTPGSLLNEARAAAKAVDDRHREQARTIDEIQKQSR